LEKVILYSLLLALFLTDKRWKYSNEFMNIGVDAAALGM
jgi:hypothetical protein